MNRRRMSPLAAPVVALLLLSSTALTPARAQEPPVLFSDDFEDGQAKGWDLESGWQISRVEGNYVLSGTGHVWARLPGSEELGTIESFESRINLQSGSVHVNYRLGRMGSRYFVRLEQGRLSLYKSIVRQPPPAQGDAFEHLVLAQAEMPSLLGVWHTLRIVGTGSNLQVYVDDELKMDYTDEANPYLAGGIAFESLDDSRVLVDDVVLRGQPPTESNLQWTFTGGPRGGIGYDIRLNPLAPQILWVTDAYAGAHQSLDGGLTWTAKNEGITARVGFSGDAIPVFSLTIDPRNPNIIWAGTQGTRGVFKSVDGGETWVEMDNGIAQLPNMEFRGFTVDPADSNTVYVGGNSLADPVANDQRGFIYETTDGGQHWRLLIEPEALVRWIIVDPTDSNVIYASTGIFDRNAIRPEGVLKSTDGGQTWLYINTGLTSLAVGALAMDPRDPQTLIAGTGKAGRFADEPNEIYGGVFKTTDGGEHWRQVDPIHASDEIRFSAVAFAPSNPDIVYADAGHLILRSEDSGETWRQLPALTAGENRGTPIALAVHPANPDFLYMNAYDGGVFTSADGGRTWQDASVGYSGSQSWDIAVDPADPAYVVVASKNGVHVSPDGGGRWQGRNTSGWVNNMLAVAIDPSDRNAVLIGQQINGSVWYSTSAGMDWRAVLGPLGEDTATGRRSIYRIVFAPSDPNVVYAATGIETMMAAVPRDTSGPGVYKSLDGGWTWQAANRGLEATTLNILSLAVHPADADTVYIGTLDSGVYKSTTGGAEWSAAREGLLPREIRALAIDPLNPEVVYAGAELGGIWKSGDGGASWEQSSYGMPPEASIHSIVVDPATARVVYAADRSTGVYRSTDGGATWARMNEGLHMRAVNALALTSDGLHLYAATEGGGVYRLDLNGQPPEPAAHPAQLTPAVAATPTSLPPTAPQPTAVPTSTPPSGGSGICGGAAALPLALVMWLRRRKIVALVANSRYRRME